MRRRFFYLLMVLAITLSLSTPVLAGNSGRQFATGNAKSYIVVMASDPILAYKGGIAGYAATKPGNGQKVNPNSAHVKKYESLLESNHNKSLSNAGVATNAKLHDYSFALNGYSALLTQEQVDAI